MSYLQCEICFGEAKSLQPTRTDSGLYKACPTCYASHNLQYKPSLHKRMERLCEYILNDDREKYDYEDWCKTNGRSTSDYTNNAMHIYALAKVTFEEL